MNDKPKASLAELAARTFASAETVSTWMEKMRQVQHHLEHHGDGLEEAVNGCDEAVNRMQAVYECVLDLAISLTKIVKWRAMGSPGSTETDPAA